MISFLPVKLVHSELGIFSPGTNTPFCTASLTVGVFITLWEINSIHELTDTISSISGFCSGISTISGI